MSNFTKLKLCHTLGISQSTHIWVKGALTALLLVLCGNVAKAQSDVIFNDGVRYSQWVIDSRIGDFYGNERSYGFTTYNNDLSVKKEKTEWINSDGKSDYPIQVDYVAGLVAKATIEAAEYYKNFDWSKPWFKSVEWYGNKCTVSTSPNNLDAINASKMYFGIYNLATGTFKSDAESNTASNATKQLGYALTALRNYNKEYKSDGTGGYAFPANTTVKRDGKSISLDGGWFHKKSYLNEMWLDGQYMGPATLAQLINGYSSYPNNELTNNDWDLITKQFTIVWNMCWDDTEKLLYHAFCSEARSKTWAANAEIWTTVQKNTSSWKGMSAAGHSAAFWGRAEGWYFLALVDVLEQMQKANLKNSNNYLTLLGYLVDLAAGIKDRQDEATGCWYQLVGKDSYYKASYYNGSSANEKSNYLESSCTAIFTAAYLKAIRLGLLAKETYFSIAEKAYKGMVEQFMKQRTDGTVDLLGCCKSAGVGTDALGKEKFRDGSNAYYLHGYDVTPTSTNEGDYYTEGKVLGAFILAATEYEREYQKSMPMLLSKDLNSTYTLSSNEPLTVEVLGDGTPEYQWWDATETTPSAITGARNASYTPTKSGKYYCKITVPLTSTAAKTRAESYYTITTNTADVTVESTGTETGGTETSNVIFSLTVKSNQTYNLASGADLDLTPYATVTGGTALVHNGKDSAVDIFYSDNININGSSKSYVKLSLSTPLKEGDVITFTLGDGATDTFYLTTTSSNSNCSVNNGTYTVTSSDGLASSTELYIWKNSGGKFKSITITRSGSSTETTGYIVTATADNGTGTVTITDNSGNIIESGSQVNSGTSLTFTATPNEGYEFSSWTVTGTTGTADGATYTIASLTEATSVTANFKTGSSVIYFTGSGTTTSNTDVLSATGYMKSKPGEITYKEKQYSNALKMESSTSVTLKLSSESDVVLVFNPSNSGKTIIVDGKEYTINTNGLVTITSLAVGEHTIARGDDETHLYAVDIQPTGPSITISTQPKSADYATGATTVDPLTVEATLDGYTLSYQWYQNTTNSNTGGTAISGETAKSYTPTLSSTAGTTYYYCVVTAEKEGSKTLTATSDVAVITVSDPYIKFTTQPTSGSYAQGDTPSDLTVVAATNLGEPTYQWYYKSSETAEFKEITTDATSASYTPSTSTAGTTYYYCVATAKKDGITKTATSNTVSVTVASATYSYKVNETGINAPDINTSLYITDKNKTKLVKMTFGGWKWNEGKYSINRKEIGEGTTDYTDSWKPSDQEPDVAPIDNHNYWFSGTNDAMDESKAVSEQVIYGKKRYGWFKTKTTNTAGKVTTYPFTLPVRGSFMTFEPTMNGTLSIYILQNGAWNTNRAGKYTDTDGDGTIDFNNGDIVAGEFRPHAFYVTNQRGLTVQEFSPKYSVETKQTVTSDYYCMFTTDDDYTEEKYNDPHNVARWTEFAAYMSVDEQQRCHDNWKNGENGAQTIIELDNGSFLAVQKGIVKYTFHVTGNETYYFFSNFSKMGFSGARFTPDGDDAQPIETLSLSDTKEYTVPTAGTDAVVGNVTIPQYESITLDRTFKAGQWTTLTLPFNLTQDEVQSIFGAGTQIIMLDKATLSSDGGARLHFIYHEIQNVLPGYPYLIKPTLTNITNDANVSVTKADNNTALTSFTVYGKCINPSIDPFKVVTDPYTFMGTPGYCTADLTNNSGKSGYSVHYKANDIFVSEGDGKLYVSGDSSYGKGYRAWLKNNKSGTNAVKSISVVMSSLSDDDDTTTSIDVAEMAPDLIEALGIQTGVYNLSGQRVANDTRNLKAGIYIVNGKKTVVR